jgi:hypothetical protein
MAVEKIAEIIDPNFKNGEGKKGPWYLMKIVTDSGKAATVFGPANIGDDIDMEFNDQYKNWSGTVVQAQQRTHPQQPAGDTEVKEMLTEVLVRLADLQELVSKGSSVVNSSPQARDWSKVGRAEPLPTPPQDVNRMS